VSEPVLIALIGCTQAVLVALVSVLAVRVGRVQRDAAATREQVVNDHSTNMREENDTRHNETRSWFRDLRRDIGGIREELRGLRSTDRALDKRIQQLEEIEITEGKNRAQ